MDVLSGIRISPLAGPIALISSAFGSFDQAAEEVFCVFSSDAMSASTRQNDDRSLNSWQTHYCTVHTMF